MKLTQQKDDMKLTHANRIYINFFIISTLIMLSACDKEVETEVKEVARPVKLMTLNNASGKIRREYPGVVAAVHTVELGFEVSGKIIELPIKEGQKVKKGEVLARLDPLDFKAIRDSAESNRLAASAAYERTKRIFDQNAGSQAEVDRTLRNIQIAKEELKKAQKALNDTYLRAPFTGEIAKKNVENFQNIKAKQPLILIHDTTSLKMDVMVPEQDIALGKANITPEELTRATKPKIEISTVPGKRFPAHLHSFTTSADPITRAYEATFAFANPPDVNVLPGMTAKLILDYETKNLHSTGVTGFMVPIAAIISDKQAKYVWRVDPDTMRVSGVQVELSDMSGSKVRILSSLKQGDHIAISAVHHLREKMLVRPLSK